MILKFSYSEPYDKIPSFTNLWKNDSIQKTLNDDQNIFTYRWVWSSKPVEMQKQAQNKAFQPCKATYEATYQSRRYFRTSIEQRYRLQRYLEK